MKYDYSVIYNGKLYRAGEEVPVVTQEKTSEDNDEKITPKNEVPENEGADSEKTDDDKIEEDNTNSEDTGVEPKKSNRKRTKV